MKFNKITALLPFLFSVTVAQTINIGGIVKDSSSSTVLKGVEVRLLQKGLADTTDNTGAFLIHAEPTGSLKSNMNSLSFVPPRISKPGILTFLIPERKRVSIRTFSIKGQLVFSSNEEFGAGIQNILLPVLPCGIYIHQVRIGNSFYTLKHANTEGIFAPKRQSAGDKSGVTAVMKRSALQTVPDTLQFTKAGYDTIKFAISSYTLDTTVLLIPQTKPLDYSGNWNGITAEGEPISFVVDGNQITNLNYTLGMQGLASWTSGNVNGSLSGITGGNFSYNNGDLTFSGTFSGDTACTGQIKNSSFFSPRAFIAKKPIPSDMSNSHLLALVYQTDKTRKILTFPQQTIKDTMISAFDMVKIKPVAYSFLSRISVCGTSCNSAAFSQEVSLSFGHNSIPIKVVSPDSSDSTIYTLELERLRGSNAALKTLYLSGGLFLSPNFDSSVYSYSCSTDLDTIELTMAVSDKSSELKVNGAVMPSGTVTKKFGLNVGNNTFTILVTASDGVSKNTYTVNAKRSCITWQPFDQIVTDGDTAHFHISVKGTGINFQWQKNGSNISGANDSDYTTPPTVIADSGSAYRCIISDNYGSDTSNTAHLTIIQRPVIISGPQARIVEPDQLVTFSVTASGARPLFYHWYVDNYSQGSATDSFFTKTAYQVDSGSVIKCIVTNSVGADTATAILRVMTKPSISADLQTKIVYPGQTATFEIQTVGSVPFTYRWQKNGSDIPGTTGKSYTTPATVPGDSGSIYRCIVRNDVGADTSKEALLKVTNITTVTDIDGHIYKTVTIGNQVWTIENLRTTKYNDGTSIPYDTSSVDWSNAGVSAERFCYYNNTTDADSIRKFGALYNGATILSGKLAPDGWHVPSNEDWDTLINYLIANGYNWDGTTTGNKTAKSLASKSDWATYTGDGAIGNDLTQNNTSGFSAVSGGCREDGNFFGNGYSGYFWTSTIDPLYGNVRFLRNISDNLVMKTAYLWNGYSVRLVRN